MNEHASTCEIIKDKIIKGCELSEAEIAHTGCCRECAGAVEETMRSVGASAAARVRSIQAIDTVPADILKAGNHYRPYKFATALTFVFALLIIFAYDGGNKNINDTKSAIDISFNVNFPDKTDYDINEELKTFLDKADVDISSAANFKDYLAEGNDSETEANPFDESLNLKY